MVANLCTTGYPLYPCAVRGRKIGSLRLHSKLHISFLNCTAKPNGRKGRREGKGVRGKGEEEEERENRREREGKKKEGK